MRTADYPGEAEALLEALEIFRELGDCDEQGRVLVELGLVSYHSDAAPDAATIYARVSARHLPRSGRSPRRKPLR